MDIAQGVVYLRTSDSPTAPILRYTVAASAGIAIPVSSERYIYVDYNGGTPQIAITAIGSDVKDDENNNIEL